MGILETILGTILGIVVVGVFFFYLFMHFLDFAMKGLKMLGIFLVLCVFALFFDLLNNVFFSDKDTAKERNHTSSESSYTNRLKSADAQETEVNVEQFLYGFLSAYTANDQLATANYMLENAKITKTHLNYMAYQQKQGITLELMDYQLLNIEQLTSNSYEVTTFEQFVVNHPKNGVQTIDQEIRYTIQSSDGRLLIQDLIVVE